MHDTAAKEVLKNMVRLRTIVRGAVQGVGFRPFVYRLARELNLTGWVNNSPAGVFIEVEGPRDNVSSFLQRLSAERPPLSSIRGTETSFLEPEGFEKFEIRESESSGEKAAAVLPDVATCPDCLSDIISPENRRYRYPFTNCTNCGPRFSIIRSIPYDRANTSMAAFEMCEKCRAEYDDPADRRFHAQPNACPECGPQLELWDRSGNVTAVCDEALTAAADAIRNGRIVAIKGLGGFHLVCDARNDDAVRALRRRKHREEKPLAIMSPSIENVLGLCRMTEIERGLLASPESPIVLLKRKPNAAISTFVAPRNPYLGVMLPCTPLHHLLMRELRFPIVATSGNLSDEPICVYENEAVERLAGIADVFLVHNRGIERHVDDSIVREMMGREMVLRRARGYAPLPFPVVGIDHTVVAAGAHLKNTVAVAAKGQAYTSQHIGDLENKQAYDAFQKVIEDIERLYEVRPETVACDLHPDYISSKWAAGAGLDKIPVQHHYAHILSCMAENETSPPVLGVAWDGTGFGTDGTIWGGEFLTVGETGFERSAHLRAFRLPGGDKAVREPRRSALGLLYEVLGEKVFDRRDLYPVVSFSSSELKTIGQMLGQGINSPVTSSTGRLFDAVAAILGLRERAAFEGQAAMELEFLAEENEAGAYEIKLNEIPGGPAVLDWEPMLRDIVHEIDTGVGPATVAARFHNTLVEMIVEVANRARLENVVLSGGCFQNRYLLEHAIKRLKKDDFCVYWHRRIPTNDGGIALGQVAAVALANSIGERRIRVCA